MNRSKMIKAIARKYSIPDALWIRGPANAFGTEGEVSYVLASTFVPMSIKEQICREIEAADEDVVEAYVTKGARMRKGVGPMMGSNIKVVYRTRANGDPA